MLHDPQLLLQQLVKTFVKLGPSVTFKFTNTVSEKPPAINGPKRQNLSPGDSASQVFVACVVVLHLLAFHLARQARLWDDHDLVRSRFSNCADVAELSRALTTCKRRRLNQQCCCKEIGTNCSHKDGE